MIMVDVFVPSVSKNYTFQLDETARISLVIAELTELICKQEQSQFVGNKGDICLCVYKQNAIMSNEKTLRDYGIIDGGRLILV